MENINYNKIKQRSRRSAILSLLGILIFVSSLIYASINLSKSEKIIQQQKYEVDSLLTVKESINDTLNQLINQLENTRRATRFITMGINHFHNRDYSKAVEAYNLALELDSLNPVVYDYKGYSLYRNKQYDQAIKSLEKAIEIEPSYTWGYYDLSLALWANGNQEEAIEAIKILVSIEPDFKDVIKNDGQFSKMIRHPEIKEIINK